MTRRAEGLAVLGGEPEFASPLHVGRPHIGDREAIRARVDDAIERRWLTNDGRYVAELEERVADHLGVAHCVAVSSATTALQIAIRAAGVEGEVLVPSFTFVATVHAASWVGLEPAFCDVDPATHNVEPAVAADVISGATGAIVPVHLWGRPCDVSGFERLAAERDLKLIFDASHAFGCSREGRLVGGGGDAEVLSFHATKVLNAGEGGAVVTDDEALARRVRLLRNYGFAGYDEVVCEGINGKLPELSAALALASLEGIEGFVERNTRNLQAYRSALDGLRGIRLVEPDAGERHNHHYAVVEVDAAEAGISRDALHGALWAENALARRYFYPGVHRMEPYRAAAPESARRLAETERLCERTLALPSGGELEPAQARRVGELIGEICQHGPAVERALAEARRG